MLGKNKDRKNMTAENAQQMITEALIDMKLENQTEIWENMVINFNNFTPPDLLNCSNKRYNNQCNFYGYNGTELTDKD